MYIVVSTALTLEMFAAEESITWGDELASNPGLPSPNSLGMEPGDEASDEPRVTVSKSSMVCKICIAS